MKGIRRFLVFILTAAIIFTAGCGIKDEDTAKTTGTDETEYSAITTTLVGGSPSGVWFMLSTAIAESLGKTYSGSIMHPTPGNNYANLFRINDYEVEFALTHSSLAFDAVNAKGQFEEKFENIGAIASFYPSVMQLAFKKDLGIETFLDIIDNKIPVRMSIGSDGGVAHNTLMKLLGEYDLAIEDLEEWGCRIYLAGNKDSAELFSDGVIDGMFKVASAPTPTMTQTGSNEDMVFVKFEEEVIQKLVDNCGYTPINIPAGTYKFGMEDVKSVTTFTILGASLQTSEQNAYMVTKAICENLEYISTVHSSLEGISLESLVIDMGMPLHPGAVRYYREIGLID